MVEYIKLVDLESDVAPVIPQRMKMNHGWRPSVHQVKGKIYVVGGIKGTSKGRESRNKFIELWDGHSWTILQTSVKQLQDQLEAKTAYLPPELC